MPPIITGLIAFGGSKAKHSRGRTIWESRDLTGCLAEGPAFVHRAKIDRHAKGTDQADKDQEVRTKTAIEKTLKDQAAAWNAGNIVGFMNGYVRDDSLRFSSGGTTKRGWEEALKRYQSSYSTKEKMGTLKFTDLEILVLNEDYAEVFGAFHLTREQPFGDASGLFTLLMQRHGSEWLVLHDHTSSADE